MATYSDVVQTARDCGWLDECVVNLENFLSVYADRVTEDEYTAMITAFENIRGTYYDDLADEMFGKTPDELVQDEKIELAAEWSDEDRTALLAAMQKAFADVGALDATTGVYEEDGAYFPCVFVYGSEIYWIPVDVGAPDETGSVTISFDSCGGTEVAALTGSPGGAVTAPSDPTRRGYTFTGWDPEVPETFPSADLTCTAQWSALQVVVDEPYLYDIADAIREKTGGTETYKPGEMATAIRGIS